MVIAIYGMGLIGGSLGRAIIKNTNHKVLGADINSDAILQAKMLSACDEEINDENISSADIVILAVTPLVAISLMEEITPKLKTGAIVVDACGTKRRIVDAMEKLNKKYENISFIGVHPMAGREYSGITHSTAGLFEHAYFIITPVHTDMSALTKVKEFFTEIGCAGLVVSTAAHHDEVIAFTSQLAHIISSSYVKSPMAMQHAGYSAGSFRDLTRVAKLNPEMWTELFMENRDNLINEIEILEKHIGEYKKALIENNEEELKDLLLEGVEKKELADKAKKDLKYD
jgi:prephenate dehydrogenase